jgi:hypothetical protein
LEAFGVGVGASVAPPELASVREDRDDCQEGELAEVDMRHSVDGVSEDFHRSCSGGGSSGEYLGMFDECEVAVKVEP